METTLLRVRLLEFELLTVRSIKTTYFVCSSLKSFKRIETIHAPLIYNAYLTDLPFMTVL